MNYFKGWIVPIIMLSILLTVIWVGIFQANSEINPWDIGRSDITRARWSFLEKN
jgi:hypothetical protein